ncbi:MAG: aminotransferase class I/II-fold pyridoxal phosphate-dependent enzyme [Acidobacteria bacterium]|nr:aminotransferase class I/II-fold pyridoxal phosphate-dependent enzyme [Acidobacteriota bacterium]
MKIPDFRLDQWLNQHQFGTAPPEFDLASSTGPHWTARELLGLLGAEERERLFETELLYSHTSGAEKLCAAIGEMQGVGADEVRVVTGASEALLIIFFLAAEPGANVILPFPLFPPTAVVPKLLGLETRFYHLRRENDFGIDLDEVKKLADDKTRLLLVNSPHNPTGATLCDEEMRELHDFAAGRGIQFVSDEVYHPVYHGRETASAALLPRATVLGSFSKSLSLSGLRLGWIIERDEARLHSYAQARSYFTISNAPLGEELASAALRHRETIFARAQKVASANLALLDQFFAEHAARLSWVRPRGGMTAFPWLADGGDAREFCREMAGRGVLLLPGDCWEMAEHFRLGFGVSEAGFAEGLQRIAEYLREGGRPASASPLGGMVTAA